MDTFTTRPIEEIDSKRFRQIVAAKSVEISPHALSHLSAKQRKVFKESELFALIEKETPRKAYLQRNGRYAIYYRRSDGYRKLIVQIEETKITIVTFMDTPEIPKLRI